MDVLYSVACPTFTGGARILGLPFFIDYNIDYFENLPAGCWHSFHSLSP